MQEPALILFDGTCHLCSGVVQFLAKRDRAAQFRFAPLTGPTARRECKRLGIQPPTARPDTIVVIAGSNAWMRSDAVIEIARRLPWPWRSCAIASVLPRPFRDAIYRWVARNRVRWFGISDSCAIPTPELRQRLLD
jgi:predicted DCC family thiol-disulfide oxidoreductase YuxK